MKKWMDEKLKDNAMDVALEKLFDELVAKNANSGPTGMDNMTAILIKLNN